MARIFNAVRAENTPPRHARGDFKQALRCSNQVAAQRRPQAYVDLKSIFEVNKNPQRIIELLSLIAGEKILPGETLVIFDEIQECPAALNALKYFKEKANEYHIISAGSLLGTLLAQPKSYPVGMVNLLDLSPLTFDEFLAAVEPSLYEFYCGIQKEQPIEEIFHRRLMEACNNYFIIGGMPEYVASWIKYKDPARACLGVLTIFRQALRWPRSSAS